MKRVLGAGVMLLIALNCFAFQFQLPLGGSPPSSPDRKSPRATTRTLTGNVEARAEDGAAWVARLCRELEIPPLGTYGVGPKDVPALVEKAAVASSMKGNPIALTPEEMAELVGGAL